MTYNSIFDLFKVGIGPSSSHTVGPINASNKFIKTLNKINISNIKSIDVELYGSLAYTGIGHKTDIGILMGLSGYTPEQLSSSIINRIYKDNKKTNKIMLNGDLSIKFDLNKNIHLNKSNIETKYSNMMKFVCIDINNIKHERTYFSVGGGFVIDEYKDEKSSTINVPFNFKSSKEMLTICDENNFDIHDLIIKNEMFINDNYKVIISKILNIWKEMNNCIKNGMKKKGPIDKNLNLERRAFSLHQNIMHKDKYDPLEVIDWVNLFAISVCEENASGARIVTAPTNGAAGIIPATIKYYDKFINESNQDGIIRFLTTSSAIGNLFKNNASISGADMGCQGEVGVACSMAAAGLTAAMGGTVMQIENAAEIGMEHNLGLTCDPINGLVQIPCIERNSMGAIKAINASRLALNGSGEHKVSLDQVIQTMKDTGKSMNSIFKETSLGGLAVNVIEC